MEQHLTISPVVSFVEFDTKRGGLLEVRASEVKLESPPTSIVTCHVPATVSLAKREENVRLFEVPLILNCDRVISA